MGWPITIESCSWIDYIWNSSVMARVVSTRSDAAGSLKWTVIGTREGHLWCSAKIHFMTSALPPVYSGYSIHSDETWNPHPLLRGRWTAVSDWQGVIIDEQFTMKEHVRRICCSAYHQLRQLRVVRKSLSTKACEALVHAFVSSRLDYCNCLLYSIAEEQLNFLQSVLRSAARLVLRKRKFDSITTDMRDKLHWLPVQQRIEYKICMLVLKCRRNQAPTYPVASPWGGGVGGGGSGPPFCSDPSWDLRKSVEKYFMYRGRGSHACIL